MRVYKAGDYNATRGINSGLAYKLSENLLCFTDTRDSTAADSNSPALNQAGIEHLFAVLRTVMVRAGHQLADIMNNKISRFHSKLPPQSSSIGKLMPCFRANEIAAS